MTQEQLDRLNRVKETKAAVQDAAKRQEMLTAVAVSNLDKEMQTLCDHTYPDGKSAVVGHGFCHVCELCSWSDL